MSHQANIEPTPAAEPSVGDLVHQLSEQTSRLVRDEMQLAQAEIKDTVKHVGVGAGLFSAAGLLAFFGLAALITTAIIALALVLPLWLSALIITVVLFIAAGIMALVGKRQVKEAAPVAGRTTENVKRDVQEVKESTSHEHTP